MSHHVVLPRAPVSSHGRTARLLGGVRPLAVAPALPWGGDPPLDNEAGKAAEHIRRFFTHDSMLLFDKKSLAFLRYLLLGGHSSLLIL